MLGSLAHGEGIGGKELKVHLITCDQEGVGGKGLR